MIGMVDIEFIKKKHFQEGWSIRRLAKVLAINRITVRKVLAHLSYSQKNIETQWHLTKST